MTPPKIRSQPKTRTPSKTRKPPKTKTPHEIKRLSVEVEEVQGYMLNLQNNPDFDEFPMNKRTIRLQISVLEVEYYKTRHIYPVLAEVGMEFYHSLPPVQEIWGK